MIRHNMLTQQRYCQYYLTPCASICQITVNINNKTLHNKRLIICPSVFTSLLNPVGPLQSVRHLSDVRTREYWLLGVVTAGV